MSLIAKWAWQLAVVVVLGWTAAVTAGWSSSIVNGTGTERLAQLTPTHQVTSTAAHDMTLAGSAE